MFQILLWIVFPYTVLAIVGMGLVWQYDTGKEDSEQTTLIKSNPFLSGMVGTLMILTIVSGFLMVLFYSIADEPQQLFKWFISVLQLKPDMNLILDISILSQAHFIIFFLFLLGLAFTDKVSYLLKPYVYMKNLIVRKK